MLEALSSQVRLYILKCNVFLDTDITDLAQDRKRWKGLASHILRKLPKSHGRRIGVRHGNKSSKSRHLITQLASSDFFQSLLTNIKKYTMASDKIN